MMTPFFRKFALIAHITFSVGWLGAVAGFLALAIAGLTSQDTQMVRSTYFAMELIAWFVIVPSNFASLLTGIVQSFGTPWGLFKHYWVLIKFLLTIAATIILLLHMQPISYMADLASKTEFSISEFKGLRIQLMADAVVAFVVLLVATILSVYKPWGRTQYAMPKQHEQQNNISILESTNGKSWGLYLMFGIACLLLLIVVLHIMGGDMGGH